MKTDSIGDASSLTHPLAQRLRNCNIPKVQGGSFGYRGRGYGRARKKALWLARNRSSATGLDASRATLEVDHIDPYRLGGVTPHTNEQTNLRVLDSENNSFLDNATGFRERKRKRRMREF
jgi:hypothetical protein